MRRCSTPLIVREMPISAHTSQRGYRQREQKLQVLAKVWRKTSCIGDSVNRGSHHGNSMELSQKSESRITICSSSPTPRYISKKTKNMSSKNACTPIFIVALFTVAKIWKQPECPSTDEWIKEYVIYISTRNATQL